MERQAERIKRPGEQLRPPYNQSRPGSLPSQSHLFLLTLLNELGVFDHRVDILSHIHKFLMLQCMFLTLLSHNGSYVIGKEARLHRVDDVE